MILLINSGFNKGLENMTAALVFKAISLSVALVTSSGRVEGESPIGGCDYAVRDVVKSPAEDIKTAIVDVQCGATTRDASWIVMTSGGSNFSYEKDRVASFIGTVSSVEWSGANIVVRLGNSYPIKVEKLPPGGGVFFIKEK